MVIENLKNHGKPLCRLADTMSPPDVAGTGNQVMTSYLPYQLVAPCGHSH
jgi:hypothetical protein